MSTDEVSKGFATLMLRAVADLAMMDTRLNERVEKVLKDLSGYPTASVPEPFSERWWKISNGFHRFVSPQEAEHYAAEIFDLFILANGPYGM